MSPAAVDAVGGRVPAAFLDARVEGADVTAAQGRAPVALPVLAALPHASVLLAEEAQPAP
jgi:hypothetical protein